MSENTAPRSTLRFLCSDFFASDPLLFSLRLSTGLGPVADLAAQINRRRWLALGYFQRAERLVGEERFPDVIVKTVFKQF